jgi:hypothetical protein
MDADEQQAKEMLAEAQRLGYKGTTMDKLADAAASMLAKIEGGKVK